MSYYHYKGLNNGMLGLLRQLNDDAVDSFLDVSNEAPGSVKCSVCDKMVRRLEQCSVTLRYACPKCNIKCFDNICSNI